MFSLKSRINLIVLCGTLLSCSNLKITEEYQAPSHSDKNIEEVHFFSGRDSLPEDILLHLEFVYRGEIGESWDSIQGVIVNFAKTHQCNGAVFKQIGFFEKGYGFYAKADLFYYEPLALDSIFAFNNRSDYCSLNIMRNEISPIGSMYEISFVVEGQEYSDFKNETAISVESKLCTDLTVVMEKKSYQVSFGENQNVYYWIYKDIGGSQAPGSMQISVGDFILQVIENPLLGKLIVDQLSLQQTTTQKPF
ncbi:MAG: hypothetical protein SchgKO_10780 [Schleiferiaceae bacterium]